tara:strand:+ start:606 stop:1175 length:570 start_codon:yes stop_codon:yes gene_type:complete
MSWVAVGVGISAVSFLSGASARKSAKASERKQAKIEYNYLGQQMAKADESLAALEPVKQSKLDVAQASYMQDIGDLSAQTGQSKEDLQGQFQSMIQKSGLATSGSANVKASQMWKRIGSSFGRGQQGLMGRLGEKMGAVEEWYESEKARVGSEKQRYEHQRRLASSKGGGPNLMTKEGRKAVFSSMSGG